MKVMALNSSPRGDGQSKTAIMLNSLNAVGSIVRAKIVYGRLTTR